MTFLRSFFLNFLIVFFVNRVIPGIQVATFEKLPDVIADVFFSLVLGFINAAVVYILMICNLKPSTFKLGISTFVVSFTGFAIMAIFPLGVEVQSFGGYLFASLIVWLIAFFSNYLERVHIFKE